jgi:glucose/arabinose dehydrogenase
MGTLALARPGEEATAVVPINFIRGSVAGSGFTTSAPTSLEFGPDGRLYVADGSGRIQALTLDSNKAVTGVQQITSAADLQEVYGIAFDPNDATSPPPVYITNTISGFGDAGQSPPGGYDGMVTKISGPAYGTRTDIITGLPVSNSGHQANGLAFGPDGRLYVAQGSTTNAGTVNPNAGLFQREEVPTSGALLVANVNAPGFNGAITYSPANTYNTLVEKTGGDVEIYAYGLRNPYDIVFHSNGKLYNTDNGPNVGYGPGSETCTTAFAMDPFAPDELNVIVEDGYYGHPNRNRGLAGDTRQCTYHPGTEASNDDYTAPIGLLPTSSNGIAEYKSGVFEGQLQGDLIYVAWVDSTMHRVELSGDGSSVVSDTTLATNLPNALDVAIQADGTIFVANWGANSITFFKPDETPATSVSVTAISPPGGPVGGGQAVTITGTNFTTTADTTVTIDQPGCSPCATLTNMVVQNSTTITGITPANSAGLKDVVVTNSVGTGTLTNGYNYTAGGGTQPPVANAGPDWSGPIAHNDHAHVTLDGRASTDSDGFITSYQWTEGSTVLSTASVDSVQFTLGEHLVTLTVTDNDGYIDTDQVRVIVTLTAENPEPFFCFDVDGDTDVDLNDVTQVGSSYGTRFANTGYQPGYARMRDYNADRVINSGDVLGTLSDLTASCPQVDREIRDATVWMEQFRNVNTAIAAGFVQVTQYVPGQGRHMVLPGPGGPLAGQDDEFIAGVPESLLYEPDSTVPGGWRLAGAMWIMPINLVPLVPEGFTGNEDAWHYHNGLCLFYNPQDGNTYALAENTTQQQCTQLGGNVWVEKAGWLVHLWSYHLNPTGRFVEINPALTTPPATGSATISVDANPGLAGVQNTRQVGAGAFTIDIVGSGLTDVAAFNFDLEYDPAIFSGATIASGPSVDRNPDSNQAFLNSTGRTFQCTPPDPNGAVTSGTKKAARISCVSTGTSAGPNAAGTVLASVTLNAIGNLGSASPLTLKNVNVFNSKNLETASCAPTQGITATCANASIGGIDTDGDGWVDSGDNCPMISNASQANASSNTRLNGVNVPGDDVTWLMSDTTGDLCDDDDDNDGLTDADEAGGALCSGATTNPMAVDSDGDNLTDGWECVNGSNPNNPTSAFLGTGMFPNDADGDRLLDLWERRGYNGSDATTDSDSDGCHDMVEAASFDNNKTIADADRLAVARRALGIWAAEPTQDHALDVDKNGFVGDPDRLFVARAALMPDWLPKSCP